MAWWQHFFNKYTNEDRTLYYEEGLALVEEDKLHEALTSFRLALKQTPGDEVILQQIAIVSVSYTHLTLPTILLV